MVAGLILAFVFGTVDVGYYTTRYEVSWGIFFLIFASAFVGGMILIGFAELIERQTETNQLLKQSLGLSNKQFGATDNTESKMEGEPKLIDTKGKIDWDLEAEDTLKIHDYFFKEKKRYVNEIIATPYPYKFIVIAGNKEHLIKIDRENTNQVLELNLLDYPEVKDWLDGFEEGL